MSKPLYVIAASRSGTNANAADDLEVLLRKYRVNYRLKVTNDPAAAHRAVSRIDSDTYGAVAALGGDGTVIPVLKAALRKQLPVLILPGGSANALAKGLSMPADLDSCVKLYASNTHTLRYLNVSLMDGEPFFLDLHAGLAAETVMKTPRHLKRRFGALAYYISGIKQMRSARPQRYELTIDGREIAMTGYACMVVNEGEHRFLGVPIFRWPMAGSLSVAIVRSMKPAHMALWWISRKVTGRNLPAVLKTWRGQSITLRRLPQKVLADDEAVTVKLPLEVSMSPHSVIAIAPVREEVSWPRNLWLRIRTTVYRYTDHLKRLILGVPSRDYCQIGPHLYVGGRFRRQAMEHFHDWGITGIVNMQERRPIRGIPSEIRVLHLPTPDHTAPSLDSLTRGIRFIQEQIAAGGAVYVHCRLGEGRGPTMAIAYLLQRGMRLEDAIQAIRKFRPFINPNKLQLRQLARWHEAHARKSSSEPS